MDFLVTDFLMDQVQVQQKNTEKVNECKKRYRDAIVLPRKQKKLVRRLATKDYIFWSSLKNWHESIFKFNI